MLSKQWIKSCSIQALNDKNKWNNQFDYQPLFEENLNEKTLPNKEQLRLVKILQGKLAVSFKTKYYALILFDGDQMGAKLFKASSPQQHKKFSNLLTAFAREARKTLESKGQTVYVGGDDFLGFVNLHYLFDVMIALRNLFKTLVSDKAKDILKIVEEFTFSAGIVIAHYKMPLAEVLKTVRKVEQKAKKDGDRNAFCITAIKHSGEIQEAVFKWGNEKQDIKRNEHWAALQLITEQLSNSTFSNKFITSLTKELYQLSGFDLKDIVLMHNKKDFAEKAIFTEMQRLVGRAYTTGSQKEKEGKVNLLCQQLQLLYSNRAPNPKQKDVFKGVQNFVHALQITDFLSRKIS